MKSNTQCKILKTYFFGQSYETLMVVLKIRHIFAQMLQDSAQA